MIYADSSFLASHYLQDAHSTEVDRRMAAQPQIWLTQFHAVEVSHAIFLHVFFKKLSRGDAALVWDCFNQDRASGVWVSTDLPQGFWESGIDLARRYGPTLGIRTLDSLHVACALELKAIRFWTFDDRQARLAEAAGLDTSA